ncbi:SH3 domain-containing protein [bacterium]|nr:SH3 domain-containing protein [bacterium]
MPSKICNTLAVIITFLTLLQCAETQNITIIKPDKLNRIFEQQLDFSVIPDNKLEKETIKSVQNSDIDLKISTKLLFTEKEQVIIYNKPEFGSEKIGFITLPSKIEVIKIIKNWAKIRINKDSSGWILRRNIQTTSFQNIYQKRMRQVANWQSKKQISPKMEVFESVAKLELINVTTNTQPITQDNLVSINKNINPPENIEMINKEEKNEKNSEE